MSSFSVDVNIRDIVASLDDVADKMRQRLDEGVSRAAFETGREMQAAAPKAHSTLVNSIKPDQQEMMSWTVGPHVEYAEYLEQGTQGGGFVPFNVLLSWVRTKQVKPRKPEWDETDLVMAIQRKILQRGSAAQPFAKPLVDSGFVEQKLRQLVEQKATQAFAEAGL
jgi:Bacteriophage HK97-gp10, putative tail-component